MVSCAMAALIEWDAKANKAARDSVSMKARRVAIKGCSGGMFLQTFR
jgi:hypothetical protein